MRVLCLLSVVLLASACASARFEIPPGRATLQGVILDVSPLSVQQGEAVELVLFNGSNDTVEMGVFGCMVVERWDGTDWQVRQDDNERACIQPLIVVRPGRRYEGGFLLDVAPGRIRLVHRFNFRGKEDSESLITPAIRVTS